MRWQFRLNVVAGAGATRYIGSQYNSGSRRSWGLLLATNNELFIITGKQDGTGYLLGASTLGVTPTSGDLVDILWESGVIKTYINGVLINTVDYSGTATAIYNQETAELNIGGYFSAAGLSYSGSLCCFKIWVDNILDSDTPKFVAPMGDKQGIDLISGTIPAVVGTVDMTVRADDASYDCEDNGFAVKTGKIYPKNYAGTGYAGLVGDPDAVYQGLIATKGQPEIGTKQYLGTEYDFGDAAARTDAGISWDEWNDTDDNLNTVGTAETDLDTDYYNAITASLMTCTSIAGYAGTSNVKSRLFFKVADRVMKDDGSFLAESGTVQEILVYKTDLTAGQIAKVRKYCKDTGV